MLSRNGLVYRYRKETDDGLRYPGATLLIRSFWIAKTTWLVWWLREARRLVERLGALGNDLGLFSEEVDPHDGSDP